MYACMMMLCGFVATFSVTADACCSSQLGGGDNDEHNNNRPNDCAQVVQVKEGESSNTIDVHTKKCNSRDL